MSCNRRLVGNTTAPVRPLRQLRKFATFKHRLNSTTANSPNQRAGFTGSAGNAPVVNSDQKRACDLAGLASECCLRDPRIDRLRLRCDETNARGIPTRVADLAGKVSSILVEIEKLRAEVEVASRQVMTLTAREAALRKALQQSESGPSAVSIGANALTLETQSDQQLNDEPDFEFQQERLETVSSNLKARRLFVQRTQDLIATRISTVQRMLDLFTRIEDGALTKTRKRRRIRRVRRRK